MSSSPGSSSPNSSPQPYRKILLASDGSESAFGALGHALALAALAGAELHMLCVEDLPYIPTSVDEIEEERKASGRRFARVVSRAVDLAAQRGLKLHPHVRPGHPVQDILAYLAEHQFDLLVIGFHGHSNLYDRLIGGTADRLIRLSPCPVLVVKTPAR